MSSSPLLFDLDLFINDDATLCTTATDSSTTLTPGTLLYHPYIHLALFYSTNGISMGKNTDKSYQHSGSYTLAYHTSIPSLVIYLDLVEPLEVGKISNNNIILHSSGTCTSRFEGYYTVQCYNAKYMSYASTTVSIFSHWFILCLINPSSHFLAFDLQPHWFILFLINPSSHFLAFDLQPFVIFISKPLVSKCIQRDLFSTIQATKTCFSQFGLEIFTC